jgi:hypothetical protein
VVFAGYILIQILLWAALLAFVSEYGPTSWPPNVILSLLLMPLLLIGAGSYLVFQGVTRVESVRLEAEKWLAERTRTPTSSYPKWRTMVERCSVWAPTLIVVLACLFLDGTWALATHLFHRGSGKLIGYRVSIPLNWMVGFDAPYRSEAQTWSYVTASKTTGMLRAGLDVYLGHKPSLSISEMAFYGVSGDQLEVTRDSPFLRDEMISSQTSGFGRGTITCSDYAPSYDHESRFREIACATPKGDFFCFFLGNEKDVQQFYQTLQAISPTQ